MNNNFKIYNCIKFILFFICINSIFATEWYVATNGTVASSGTKINPWSLRYALTNTAIVQPGDIIWLRGGVYSDYSNIVWPYSFSCKLSGTSDNPIIIRQYYGERAIIDGSITAWNGNWVTFWGFEFTCSNARTNIYQMRPGGLSLSGNGHKAINLVFRDTGHSGLGGAGGDIHGCIFWGVGIYEYDNVTRFITNTWTRGSSMYLQNDGELACNISDNISSYAFTSSMKAYSENGQSEAYTFDGNIVFNSGGEGIEVESLYNSITNATVINNFTYHSLKTPMGYFSGDSLAQHFSLIFSNNYDIAQSGSGVSALWLKRWQNLQVLNNTIITTSLTNDWVAGSGVGYGAGGHFIELYPSTNIISYNINNNAYYGGVEQNGPWYGTGGIFYHTYTPFVYHLVNDPYDGTNGLLSFNYWTNTHGFDVNSTYTTNMPTSNTMVLRTNRYELGRGNLVVINWESNNTVNVDISSLGLFHGQRFEVRDVQNYFGTPVLTSYYNASQPTIIIPLTMTNVSITEVEGDSQRTHTSSLFNVFVILPSIIRDSSANSANIDTEIIRN